MRLLIKSALCLVVEGFVWVSVVYGQGGPPLQTDDPGTPGGGHWEINLAGTLEHTAERTLYEAPLVDANYGVGERIQLKLEMPLLFERNGGTRSGLGNPLLGVKWRFKGDSSSITSVSAYPQVELKNPLLPLDDEQEGSSLLWPLELATAWGGLGINVEIGYRLIRESRAELIYGLAIGLTPMPRLELVSECNGSTVAGGTGSELLCQVGVRQDVAEDYTLLGALGTGVAGDPEERTRFHMYFGLQSRW